MLSDLKHVLRQARKNPVFSVGVVLILALAIGANTAEYSLTRAVLYKPLPWPRADRMVCVWNTAANIGWPVAPVAIPDYLDRRTQTTCFSDSALFAVISCNVATGPAPEQVTGLRVTPSFFSTLGVWPWKGRAFGADEAVPGREKVAILSYDLWQTKLGGRDSSLGSDIRMNGQSYRVVGIMPKGFLSPNLGLPSIGEPRVRLWLPYAFTADEMSEKGRGNWSSFMIARLRTGMTVGQAQEQIDVVQQRRANLAANSGSRKTGGFGGIVVGYREQNTSRVRPVLLILQAAVAIILLIACANVGNLVLVRTTARKRELAIRLALGCRRFGLARLLVAESVFLVMIGGALGLGLGQWGLVFIRWLGNDLLPFNQPILIDRTVLGFTLLLSLGSGVGLGLVSLVSLWRQAPAGALRDGDARGSAGRSAGLTRAVLIVAEVALALILLIAAGLALKSFGKLENVRPGFTSDNVLTAQLSLPPAAYKNSAAITRFYATALKLIRTLPGVKSASAISYLPFSGNFSTSDYSIAGEVRQKTDPGKNARFEAIDPDYFRAMRIPMLRGRVFSDADSDRAAPSVIIDRFLAGRYFLGHDPIGRQLKIPIDNHGGFRICTIVGVVGEVKTADLGETILKETLYFPVAQRPEPAMALVVKTAADPRTLVAPLRAAIQRIDPDLPAYDIQTMDERLAVSLAGYRSPMILLVLFGATALGLAILGLYAVLAYAVSQRTREIGIRIALGAQGRAILGMVVGQGLRLAVLGVALGLGASLGLSRLLRSLLFGVSSADPVIYVAVPLLLLAVAMVACLFPARRANRIDPIVALRSE